MVVALGGDRQIFPAPTKNGQQHFPSRARPPPLVSSLSLAHQSFSSSFSSLHSVTLQCIFESPVSFFSGDSSSALHLAFFALPFTTTSHLCCL